LGYVVGADQAVRVEPRRIARRVEFPICDRQWYYIEAL
jgi:hypothetical protein